MSTETTKLTDLSTEKILGFTDTLLTLRPSGLARAHYSSVFVKRNYVSDFDECTQTGYYPIHYTYARPSNAPDGVKYGVLLVFDDNGRLGEEFVQVVLSIETPPCLYIRKKGSGSGWSGWYKMTSTLLGGGKTLFTNILRNLAERRVA